MFVVEEDHQTLHRPDLGIAAAGLAAAVAVAVAAETTERVSAVPGDGASSHREEEQQQELISPPVGDQG